MDRIKSAESARVAGKKGFSLISDEKFKELYALLLQCEMLEERLFAGAACERWPGRDATTAGVAACLRRGDSITLTPRGALASFLQHGATNPKARAAAGPIEHLAAATGDALRQKLEKQGHVAVVYTSIGDKKDANEVFAIAAKLALPAIYVIDGESPAEEGCEAVPPVIRVDGTDAVAVYRVAYESIHRAREGGGPTIIECTAWPLEDETADPLLKLEQYLTGKRLLRKDWKKRLEQRYRNSLASALTAAGHS